MPAILAARNLRDGQYSITIEYNQAGKKKKFDTGVKVGQKYWDNTNKKIKANGVKNVSETNDTFTAKLKAVNDVIDRLTISNGNVPPSVAQLNAYYEAQSAPVLVEASQALPTAVADALGAYIKAQTDWQPLTIKTFSTVNELIGQFQQAKRTVWQLGSLTNADVEEWQQWLMKIKGYKNSTLGKQVKRLKQFLKAMAQAETLNPNLKVASITPIHSMKVKSAIVTLSAQEVMELHRLDLSNNPRLDRIKDSFLLQCFTGLRHSDVIRINKADIRHGFIKMPVQKTAGETTNIPVFAQATQIFDKYGYDLSVLELSNQKSNNGLKELFALPVVLETIPTLKNEIRLPEERGTVRKSHFVPRYTVITTHVGRKSFITMALQLNRPTHIVKEWSGHKSDSSFSRYVDAAQGQVEAAAAMQEAMNAL